MIQKKLFPFMIVLLIGLLMQFQSFGDASKTERTWCGGIFHQKYQVFATATALGYTTYQTGYTADGRYVGTAPIGTWYTLCDKSDKGCSRPRVAECLESGQIVDYTYSGPYLLFTSSNPYYVHAKADWQPGADPIIIQDATGRGHAGWPDDVTLDSKILAQLDDSGYSHAMLTSKRLQVTDGGLLTAEHLSGSVSIKPSTDYSSKLQIFIIKERDDISEDEARRLDSLSKHGVYENIVSSGEIYVSKGHISISGFFRGLGDGQLVTIDNKDSFGINLNNVSFTKQLNVPLKEHEHLTLISVVDGGFDVSSAVIEPQAKTMMEQNQLTESLAGKIEIYPNPAATHVNLRVFSTTDNNPVSIKAFDLLGRDLNEIYSGILHKGYNVISNVDVSRLAKGILILQVNQGGQISNHKITLIQ